MEAILFSRSLGLNDAASLGKQITSPSPQSQNPGATELIACRNVTTTDDGAIESVPGLVTALTHTLPITGVSAGKRFLLADAINTHEWTGTALVNRFPLKVGAMVHTPIDCRVGLFKSPDTTLTMQAVTVGSNPNPATSRTFAGMPAYSRAFVHGSKLYAVNASDPRFLQYSEDFHYDLWNTGDCFLGHQLPILQAGSIPGVLAVLHSDRVTAYIGSGPADFIKREFFCAPLPQTLYSGFISKALGYGHVFLCDDGVYLLGAEGLVNLTGDKLKAGALNTSYSGATVEVGKYLAQGNSATIEYDFPTKAAMKRDSAGTALTSWRDVAYFAAGNLLKKHGGLTTLPTSLTLPFSDLGNPNRKSIVDLFITGRFDAPLTLTATGLDGRAWNITVPAMGTVYNHRIKTPNKFLGNHISLKLDTTSFRLEGLRATLGTSQRVR